VDAMSTAPRRQGAIIYVHAYLRYIYMYICQSYTMAWSYELFDLQCLAAIHMCQCWSHRNLRNYARRSMFEKRDNFFS
jgi:hypothetical protein